MSHTGSGERDATVEDTRAVAANASVARQTPRLGSLETTPDSSQGPVPTRSEDVLYVQGVQRSRLFVGFFSIAGLAAAIGCWFLPQSQLAQVWLCITGGLLFAIGAPLYRIFRDPQALRQWHGMLFGYASVATIISAAYFFGPLSAAILPIPIGVFAFALSYDVFPEGGLFVTLVLAYVTLTALVMLGVATDGTELLIHSMTPLQRLSFVLPIVAIIAASKIVGQKTARATRELLRMHELALRDLARREALLQEARMELQQALEVGGPGRYSGLEIGSFQLGNVIGRGAMGEVYEGVHLETGELAAVKLLRPGSASDSRQVERFRREVAIAASLDSPHVVRVLEIPDHGQPCEYLAMELLRGQSLADILRSRSRLPTGEVVEMLRQIGAGVSAAHDAGIIHRDLKTQNIFHHRESQRQHIWKVLDFGVSKLADGQGTLTGSHIVGTPRCMSPEQARGATVDERTDLYALGVIAYRALTGYPAFSGKELGHIIFQVIHEMPAQPSAFEGIDPAMDSALAVAMAKEPADRFAHPDDLVAAIEAASRGIVAPELEERAKRLQKRHPWCLPSRPRPPAPARKPAKSSTREL